MWLRENLRSSWWSALTEGESTGKPAAASSSRDIVAGGVAPQTAGSKAKPPVVVHAYCREHEHVSWHIVSQKDDELAHQGGRTSLQASRGTRLGNDSPIQEYTTDSTFAMDSKLAYPSTDKRFAASGSVETRDGVESNRPGVDVDTSGGPARGRAKLVARRDQPPSGA